MNPQKRYSNFNATMAIAKASFRSITRSPSAVVFSLAFPLIFIVVFANIGGSGVSVDVDVAKTCDTTGQVYNELKKSNQEIASLEDVEEQLKRELIIQKEQESLQQRIEELKEQEKIEVSPVSNEINLFLEKRLRRQ